MDPIAAFKAASATVKAVVVLAVVLVIAGLLAWHFWSASSAAGTKNKVVTGQLGAQTESGKDAVSTAGNQSAAEGKADDMTRNNADAIDQANGSKAVVTPEAQDAGLRAICARPAYAGNPSCAAYH